MLVSRAWGQWYLPYDYSRDNDKQNPADMRGGKGLGMDLLYYESFEKTGKEERVGWGWVSAGWKQENVKNNQSNAPTYWTLKNGGGEPRDGAFAQPGRAFDGEQNALCHGRTTLAEQRLVSPKLDLLGVVNGDPRLVFYYASPGNYSGFCRMRLQYRVGLHGDWKDFPRAPQLAREENWTQVSVAIPKDLRRNDIYIGFLSIQNDGYGTAIDEVYVVNMVGAQAQVKEFDLFPQSSKLARGATKTPLMRIDVALSPGGGKQKLVNLVGENGKKVKIHAYNPKTSSYPAQSPFKQLELYVGQGSSFSTAKKAGTIQVVGTEPYEVSQLQITDHDALIMEGGNSYSVWVVADLKDNDEVPLKTNIWLEVEELSWKFVWLRGDDPNTKNDSDKKYYFPAQGHGYQTPEGQRSVVYKRLAYDNFDNGATQWEFPTGHTEKLWAIGNPAYNEAVYKRKGKEWPPEQVPAAYSGSKVLATGEILDGEVLRGRYFSGMINDEPDKPGLWIQKKDLIDATNVKDIYLMMQKSFNTPFGMIFIVEGRYEGEQQWVEFGRYALASSDWTDWQPLALRMNRADGRKFHLRLRAFFPRTDVSHTGFIIDDFEILGDEVQDDVGISSLEVTDSWDNGKGRKVKFKVMNYGKNPQTGATYDVYIDGNKVLGDQPINQPIPVGQEVQVETAASFDLQLVADMIKNNTHHVEVRVKLAKDEDASNNIRSMQVYSYPTIEVTDDKFYPEKFGDPMRHWFGRPYKEGYASTWIFNTVYSISKCREGAGLGGKFGTGMLLGNYIWTTGDHSAVGYEQSVLESPIFNISTTTKDKEFVMAYVTDGQSVQFRVEYRTETDNTWKTLEKSTTWEKGWYEVASPPDETGWKGSVDKYTIVKTQLPEALQGKNGGSVKVQFRVYFYNKEAGSAGGLAVNGVEIRPMRADLTITSHTPEGGCGKPLGNDETLKIKIMNSDKPAVTQEAMKLPVSIAVTRNGETWREVKQLDLKELAPGRSEVYDTEMLLPWGEEFGKNSDIVVQLLPQSSEMGLADEDVSNNTYIKTIEAKVPASFPLKELVVENGAYKLYAMKGSTLDLLSEPFDKDKYKGYKFSGFNVSGTASLEGTNKFKVSEYGEATLKYKVNDDCDMELKITIAEFKCEMMVESITPVGGQNCKDEREDLTFKVVIKDNFQPSKVNGVKLVVTQGGRELYRAAASVGSNTVTIKGADPAKRVRSGGGKLKFTVEAEADKDGSNNTKEYDKDILLYPSPLTVYLQDVQEPTYMRIAKSDTEKGENTYGSREWQFYVPRTQGIEVIEWRVPPLNYPMPSEEQGHKLRLGSHSGVIKAYASLSLNGQTCPEKEVFSVKINNQDVEVQGLGGATGLPTLCKDADGRYSLYVGVVNNSWMPYNKGYYLAFELSNSDGTVKETVNVELKEDFNPRVLRQLLLGDVPASLKPTAGATSVKLKVRYLGVYTDSELTLLEKDAYDGNNERLVDLKLSEAPKLKWEGITLENGEYVVRKVFPVGSTLPTDKLKVDADGASGMSYSWYNQSQSAKETDWTPLVNSGTLGSEYQINGVPEDRYKVEAINLSGCKAELTMRYIQTDVSFDPIDPVVNPKRTCLLSDNDGQVVLKLKNTGSKNLTSREKFKIIGEFDGVYKESGPLTFNGIYAPGERIEVLVPGFDISEILKGKKQITMNELELQVIDNWAVTENGKHLATATVQEMGVPDPSVYLLKLKPDQFVKLEDHTAELLEPTGGIKRGEEVTIQKTYGGPLLGHVKKKNEEKAVWRWRYNSRYEYLKLDPDPMKGDMLAELAQAKQKEWMKDHISEVGAAPGTLNEPKYPQGDYLVEVTDQNYCQSRVRFTVAEKAYDIMLESLLLPKSSCDMPKEGLQATAIIYNKGSMTVSKDAKIKLTLTREDEKAPTEDGPRKRAYDAFLNGVGKKVLEKEVTIGELSGGKDLAQGERVQIVVPLSLYCEYEVSTGVKASALDGMKFKYMAKVEFLDIATYNETNTDNNETKVAQVVEDYITPRVKEFAVMISSGRFLSYPGEGGYYVWKESGGTESLHVEFKSEPMYSEVDILWRLRHKLTTVDGETEAKGVDNKIKLKGTGLVDLYLTTKTGGCEGHGSFSIMGEKPDLVVKSISDGLPGELCPESVAGKRKLKVQIENLSPVPINTSDPTKPCGRGDLTEANLKLTLTDGLNTNNKIEKIFKPEEVYGASKTLQGYKWVMDASDPTEEKGNWQPDPEKTTTGVGLSGLATVEVTLDGFELDQAKWVSGAKGNITVALEGGCEDKSNNQNNSHSQELTVRKSPDMTNVLTESKNLYVRTGETGSWEEKWKTTEKLQKEMEWGKVGAAANTIVATEAVLPSGEQELTLPLTASESGEYELKVKDLAGCVASKKVSVRLPGFLALAEGSVMVTPESLINGSCEYNASERGLKITVVNVGNEPLELNGKNIDLHATVEPPVGVSKNVQWSHKFVEPEPLAVGAALVVDFTAPFKANVDFKEDGTYKLVFKLMKGVVPSVDEADNALRGAAQEVVVKRFYQPTGTIDLKEQLAKVYGKSVGELNFKQLAKTPESFKLYGLVKFPTGGAAPSGEEFEKLQKYGTEWTWYVDGEVVEGPVHSAFEKEFSVPDPYGKVQVKLKTNQGCTLESEEVAMYRLRVYNFSSITLRPMSSKGCADKNSAAGTDQEVVGSFDLEQADGVLKKGTEIELVCKYWVPEGGTVAEKEAKRTIALDRDYKEGESIGFSIKVPFKVGDNSVTMADGKYVDPISGATWPVKGCAGAPLTFLIKAGPSFVTPVETPQEARQKPYTIKLPEVQPGKEGDGLTYNWEQGASNERNYSVTKSKDYEVVITEDNGCILGASIRVDFFFKYTRSLDEMMGSLQVIDLTSGTAYQPNDQVIKDGTKVKIQPQANSGYKVVGVSLNTAPFDYAILDHTVTDDFDVQVIFEAQGPNPNPEDPHNAVESELLQGVVAVNPFVSVLRLHGAGNVASYSVYNQLGVEVLRGVNTMSGGSVLEIPAAQLHEGVYVVRLRDVNGGERVLRVVKARGL